MARSDGVLQTATFPEPALPLGAVTLPCPVVTGTSEDCAVSLPSQ